MRERGRKRQLPLWPVLLVFLATACGSDGGGPTGTDDGDRDIRGTYTVTHTFEVSSGGTSLSVDCPGSLAITTLDDGRFTGTLILGVCPDLGLEEAETVSVAGTVTGGIVTFDPGDLDAFVDAFGDIGCVVLDVDETVTGTFTGNRLTASFSATLDCEDFDDEVEFTYSFVANRTT